jgi:hypothetical protein
MDCPLPLVTVIADEDERVPLVLPPSIRTRTVGSAASAENEKARKRTERKIWARDRTFFFMKTLLLLTSVIRRGSVGRKRSLEKECC